MPNTSCLIQSYHYSLCHSLNQIGIDKLSRQPARQTTPLPQILPKKFNGCSNQTYSVHHSSDIYCSFLCTSHSKSGQDKALKFSAISSTMVTPKAPIIGTSSKQTQGACCAKATSSHPQPTLHLTAPPPPPDLHPLAPLALHYGVRSGL